MYVGALLTAADISKYLWCFRDGILCLFMNRNNQINDLIAGIGLFYSLTNREKRKESHAELHVSSFIVSTVRVQEHKTSVYLTNTYGPKIWLL